MNTEEFIIRAKTVHKDRYDYSHVIYVDMHSKIEIVCREHGSFFQTASNHVSGHGCAKCARIFSSRKHRGTPEEFLSRVKEVHGDRYDYSNVVFRGMNQKIEIICETHGSWWAMAKSHLNGTGCPRCAGKNKTTQAFVKEAMQIVGWEKYDFSQVEYTGAFDKITVICREHGPWEITPDNFLHGYGCKKCGRIQTANATRKTLEEYLDDVKKVHGDRYDYSRVEYKGNLELIEIGCKDHGYFWQLAGVHIGGSGCPHCKETTGEKAIRLYLQENHIKFKSEYRMDECRYKNTLPFDFALLDKENNPIGLIEYQGIQHYEPVQFFKASSDEEAMTSFLGQQNKDHIKARYCQEKNIPFLAIPYWEKKNIPRLLDDFLLLATQNPSL